MDLSVIAYLALLVVVALLRIVELQISRRHQREMVAWRDKGKRPTVSLDGAAAHRGPGGSCSGGSFSPSSFDSPAGCHLLGDLSCRQRRALVGDSNPGGTLERASDEFDGSGGSHDGS